MGILVAIEGVDGVGKNTLSSGLQQRLCNAGYKVGFLSFPVYHTQYGKVIKDYLGGRWGSRSSTSQVIGIHSVYALNRGETREEILDLLEKMDLVIVDRYTMSNLAYGCALYSDKREKDVFRDFFIYFEHTVLRLPLPNLCVLLQADLQTVRHRLQVRGEEQDLHEKNHSYLRSVVEEYDFLCTNNVCCEWIKFDCSQDHKKIERSEDSKEEVTARVWEYVQSHLLPKT